jgi:hypothetical protein
MITHQPLHCLTITYLPTCCLTFLCCKRLVNLKKSIIFLIYRLLLQINKSKFFIYFHSVHLKISILTLQKYYSHYYQYNTYQKQQIRKLCEKICIYSERPDHEMSGTTNQHLTPWQPDPYSGIYVLPGLRWTGSMGKFFSTSFSSHSVNILRS